MRFCLVSAAYKSCIRKFLQKDALCIFTQSIFLDLEMVCVHINVIQHRNCDLCHWCYHKAVSICFVHAFRSDSL